MMKFYKSAWFWFALAWFLVGLTAFLVLRSLKPDWGLWLWAGWGGDLLVGLGVTLLLWQRARMRALAKGVRNDAADRFEEQWKTALRTDLQRLLGAVQAVGEKGLDAVRIHWMVAGSEKEPLALLAAGGGVDITAARSHELSGEFARLASLHGIGNDVAVVLRELPDPKRPESGERLGFLLRLLQEAGKTRPVDGALVLVPFPQAGGPAVGGGIQAAMASLAELSQVEFPIHVLFEGADRLPGGTAFFAALERATPAELPGAAVPYASQDRMPEQLDDAWRRLCADQDARFQALLSEAWRKDGDAARILEFQQAFAGQAEAVKSVLKSVCGQFIGTAVPFLRSFAFLGGLGTGAAVAPGFGGAAFFEGDEPAAAAAEAGPGTAAAFWAFLAAEPLLARLSGHKQRRLSRVATGFLVGALVLSILLVAAALHGFVRGNRIDSLWRERLERVGQARWQDSTSIRGELALWKDLHDLELEIRDGRPWLLAPGFYRDGVRLPQVEARMDTMTLRLVRYSFTSQENRLRGSVQSIRDSLSDTKDLYTSLKAYLLVSRGGWQAAKEAEGEKGLAEAYVKVWSGYLGFSGPLPEVARDIVPVYAGEVAAKVAEGDSTWLGREDAALVERARFLLRSSKNQSGNYARLLGAADSLPDLTLDSLGIPQQEFTCKVLTVPKAFTRRAYAHAVLPAFEALAGNANDWVVGRAGAVDTSKAASSSEVLDELRRRYYEDYAKAWDGVLAGISCELPQENQRIATALASLSGPYNPQNPKGLVAFLKRIADETDLSGVVAQGPQVPAVVPAAAAKAVGNAQKVVSAVQSRLGDDAVQAQIRQLKDRFAVVRGLSDAAGKGELDILLKDFAQLGTLFSQWSQGDAAFQFSKSFSSQDQKNPLVHALNEANARLNLLPVDQRQWFGALSVKFLDQIRGKLAPQSGSFAGNLYKEKVYGPWQNLSKGNYPFDPYGSGEASVAEIDAFLNPKTGSFSSFLKDVEGMFSLEDKGGDGQLAVDRSGRDALQKLARLQAFFYGKNGTAWKGCPLTISVRADQRAKISFKVGNQSVDLASGAGEKRLSLRWPVAGQSGASLQATTLTNSFEDHKDGEWALLRLLESKVNGGAGNSAEAVWSFSDRSYIVDVPVSVRLEQPGNPFREKDFFQVNLPPELFR